MNLWTGRTVAVQVAKLVIHMPQTCWCRWAIAAWARPHTNNYNSTVQQSNWPTAYPPLSTKEKADALLLTHKCHSSSLPTSLRTINRRGVSSVLQKQIRGSRANTYTNMYDDLRNTHTVTWQIQCMHDQSLVDFFVQAKTRCVAFRLH